METYLKKKQKKPDKSESFSELTDYYKKADWNFTLALGQLRFVSFCMTTSPLQTARRYC